MVGFFQAYDAKFSYPIACNGSCPTNLLYSYTTAHKTRDKYRLNEQWDNRMKSEKTTMGPSLTRALIEETGEKENKKQSNSEEPK